MSTRLQPSASAFDIRRSIPTRRWLLGFLLLPVCLALGCGANTESSATPPLGDGAGGNFGGQTPQIVFLSPARDELASGIVTVQVQVAPEALAGDVLSLNLLKTGLTDTHPAAHIFEAEWDTTHMPNGEHTLRAQAELVGGKKIQAELPVYVSNLKFEALTGVAWLAGALQNATVRIWTVDNKFFVDQLLGESKTDAYGFFSIPFVSPFKGNILLVQVLVDGAKEHIQDQLSVTVAGSAMLSALIDLDAEPTLTNLGVHPWTTMGTELARALCRAGDAWLTQQQCVYTAHKWLADHIWRPESAALQRTSPTPPWSLPFKETDPYSMLSLSLLGLRQLASELSAESGQAVSTLSLVERLATDLTDGIFDGMRANPSGIGTSPVLVGEQALLNADTTRWRLAQASYRASAYWGSAVDQSVLFGHGGLYHNLATDVGPLYPPGVVAPPLPPQEPPQAKFVAPTPPQSAALKSAFELAVHAVDNAGLSAVRLEFGGDGDSEELLPLSQSEPEPKSFEGKVEFGLDRWPAGSGRLDVTLVATDIEGLDATAFRSFWLDRHPPQLSVAFPTHGSATNLNPIAFVGLLTDEPQGAGATTLHAWKGTDKTPPAQSAAVSVGPDGQFTVSVSPGTEGTSAYTLLAEDAAGHQTTVQLDVTYDATPPTLSGQAAAGGALWSATPSVVLKGTVTDSLSGAGEIRCESEATTIVASPPAITTNWSFEVELPAAPEATTWQVKAYDRASNAAPTVVITTGQDTTPPALELIAPSSDIVWTNKYELPLQGLAVDFQSGLSQVYVGLNGQPAVTAGSLQATDQPGQWKWSHSVLLPTGSDGSHVVDVYAIDQIGNKSPTTHITVNVDTVAPEIVLVKGPDFVDETECALSAAGVVSCGNAPGKQSMHLRCADGHCGSLSKYLHRWGHDAPAESGWSEILLGPVWWNWPTLSLDVLNDQKGELAVFRRTFVFPGGEKGPSAQISAWGVPIVLPEFAPNQKTLPTSSLQLPTAVEVVAQDLAGNTTTRTMSFKLRFVAPAPFVDWQAASGSSVSLKSGQPWSFGAQTAEIPFRATAPSGVRVGALKLSNPLSYPIEAGTTLSAQANSVQLIRTATKRYVHTAQPPPPSLWQNENNCSPGLCRYHQQNTLSVTWNSPAFPTNCATPAEYVDHNYTQTTTFTTGQLIWELAYSSASGQPLSASGGTITIPSKGFVLADVFLSTKNVCVLEPPATLDPAGTVLYLKPSGTCGQTSAGQGAHKDFARCNKPYFGFPQIGNTPPTVVCNPSAPQFNHALCSSGTHFFMVPYALSQLQLTTAPAGGAQPKWLATGGLPGFTGQGSAIATLKGGDLPFNLSIFQSLPGLPVSF